MYAQEIIPQHSLRTALCYSYVVWLLPTIGDVIQYRFEPGELKRDGSDDVNIRRMFVQAVRVSKSTSTHSLQLPQIVCTLEAQYNLDDTLSHGRRRH